MPEPRNDVFPDKENTKVLPSLKKQEVSEDEKTQKQETSEQKEESKEESATQQGEQTPESRLYAALEEERKMRKELKKKVSELEQKLESSRSTDEEFGEEYSDEGKALKKQIAELEKEILSMRESQTISGIYAKYPVIQDKSEEFEEYRKEKSNYSLEDIAQLFMQKYQIQGTSRKGLEQPTGGSKTPQKSGISKEDIRRLREEQPRKYIKMLKEGKINPDEIR